MKYEDFEKFVREKCVYETIYDDSDGRQILVIKMLDAYGMVNKAPREWQRLTKEELQEIAEFHFHGALSGREFYDDIEAKLKEKNG
jgi:hypothetical protein